MGHITLAAPVAHVWYTRRVPSYLGVLLDISRRNLDRVLYFAQYVVTHVDEDARVRALKRIDEEHNRLEKEFEDTQGQRRTEIVAGRDARIAELEASMQQINVAYEENVSDAIDPVMKEANQLQEKLLEQVGSSAKSAITLKSVKATIVEKGFEISNDHISQVQDLVKKHLDQIEEEQKQLRDEKLESLKEEIEKVKAEADLELSEASFAEDEPQREELAQLEKDRTALSRTAFQMGSGLSGGYGCGGILRNFKGSGS